MMNNFSSDSRSATVVLLKEGTYLAADGQHWGPPPAQNEEHQYLYETILVW